MHACCPPEPHRQSAAHYPVYQGHFAVGGPKHLDLGPRATQGTHRKPAISQTVGVQGAQTHIHRAAEVAAPGPARLVMCWWRIRPGTVSQVISAPMAASVRPQSPGSGCSGTVLGVPELSPALQASEPYSRFQRHFCATQSSPQFTAAGQALTCIRQGNLGQSEAHPHSAGRSFHERERIPNTQADRPIPIAGVISLGPISQISVMATCQVSLAGPALLNLIMDAALD